MPWSKMRRIQGDEECTWLKSSSIGHGVDEDTMSVDDDGNTETTPFEITWGKQQTEDHIVRDIQSPFDR